LLGEASDSFRLSHPAPIVADDHLERGVAHLVRDVLRVLAARELQRSVAVATLVERPFAQTRLADYPPPVPLAQVREVQRPAGLARKNEITSQLGSCALFLEGSSHIWQHVHLALA